MIKRIYEIVGKGQGVIQDITPENLLLLKSNDENGSLQNLQQVLQQGSQALLNLGNGSVFEAQLPYDDIFNQNILLRLIQGDYTSVLSLGNGNAVLASSLQSADRIIEYQKIANLFNTAEGEFNVIDYLWIRNETNMVESGATINLPTPKEGTQIQYRFPYSLVTAILTLASEEYVDKAILQLINGAPSDANTLKELNDKIVALQAIIGGSDPDGNSIVDTVAELLAVFQTYPEGTDIATVLAGKINTADIVDNLAQLVPGKVLDARQGKILADLIAAKWTAVDATGILKGIMKLYNAAGNNTDGAIDQNFFTQTTLAKRGIENANYTILATDKIVTTAAALTANRTFTLPGDAPAGKEVIITDEFGAVGTYTLTIQAPSGKKLNGVINGFEVIKSAFGWRRLITDGNGNWNFDAGIVRQQQLQSVTPFETSNDGAITSGTSITVSSWVLIPGGTFGEGMTLETLGWSRKTGANGPLTYRRYVNTTPNLAGSPVLIAQPGASASATIYASLRRFLRIKTSDGSGAGTELTNVSSTTYDDVPGTSTTAVSNVAINWNNDVYIIDALQCSSSLDSARVSSLKVRR